MTVKMELDVSTVCAAAASCRRWDSQPPRPSSEGWAGLGRCGSPCPAPSAALPPSPRSSPPVSAREKHTDRSASISSDRFKCLFTARVGKCDQRTYVCLFVFISTCSILSLYRSICPRRTWSLFIMD